jgi:pentatricopeptide repeat protein
LAMIQKAGSGHRVQTIRPTRPVQVRSRMNVTLGIFLLVLFSFSLIPIDSFSGVISIPKQRWKIDRIRGRSHSCSSRRIRDRQWVRQHSVPLRSTLAQSNADDTGGNISSSKLNPVVVLNKSEMVQQRQQVRRCLGSKDTQGAWNGIKRMISSLQTVKKRSNTDLSRDFSSQIDQSLQEFYEHAFATPYQGRDAVHRVSLGLEALQLQLSSSSSSSSQTTLDPPFNLVPKRFCLAALKALTQVNELKRTSTSMRSVRSGDNLSLSTHELVRTDAAFRLLQRLVTGVGIRHFDPQRKVIYESDFNMVLNAYSNLGQMDMAHRVVALQERTPHAPPISAVAYSILIKGYGKLMDLRNVEMLLEQARANQVESDTVMLNSLLDAYIKCNNLDKALDLFELMKTPSTTNDGAAVVNRSLSHHFLFSEGSTARPNRRTYNTVLKGLGSSGSLEAALELSREMEQQSMWDAVTTNTLVQAAVSHGEFELAENILDQHTVTIWDKTASGQHPNVEAYTNLLDGHAKSGNLTRALDTLRQMEERGVESNVVTYTCIIGALAREKKTEQAKKMLSYMQANGHQPSVVTYNSFISGLVGKELAPDFAFDNASIDSHVDEAILLLRDMLKHGLRPNAVTVSMLLNAFGKCERPRVEEAKALVKKLEADNIVTANNTVIATVLVQVCGIGEDFTGACEAFRRVQSPDVAAVNAFLDACSRCNMDSALMQCFQRYFQGRKRILNPDIISYSTAIASLLKKNTILRSRQARALYEEMKRQRKIMPDNVLVDM